MGEEEEEEEEEVSGSIMRPRRLQLQRIHAADTKCVYEILVRHRWTISLLSLSRLFIALSVAYPRVEVGSYFFLGIALAIPCARHEYASLRVSLLALDV